MILIDGARCELCGTCMGVCPVDAIMIRGNVIGIERERCIECLACTFICPVGAPESVDEASFTIPSHAGP